MIKSLDRVGTVFDDLQAVPLGQLQKRLHVARPPGKVDRNDCARTRSQPARNLGGVQAEGFVDVGQHRDRSLIHHRRRDGDPEVGWNDDLLARPNAKRRERGDESARAARHCNGVRYSQEPRKF